MALPFDSLLYKPSGRYSLSDVNLRAGSIPKIKTPKIPKATVPSVKLPSSQGSQGSRSPQNAQSALNKALAGATKSLATTRTSTTASDQIDTKIKEAGQKDFWEGLKDNALNWYNTVAGEGTYAGRLFDTSGELLSLSDYAGDTLRDVNRSIVTGDSEYAKKWFLGQGTAAGDFAKNIVNVGAALVGQEKVYTDQTQSDLGQILDLTDTGLSNLEVAMKGSLAQQYGGQEVADAKTAYSQSPSIANADALIAAITKYSDVSWEAMGGKGARDFGKNALGLGSLALDIYANVLGDKGISKLGKVAQASKFAQSSKLAGTGTKLVTGILRQVTDLPIVSVADELGAFKGIANKLFPVVTKTLSNLDSTIKPTLDAVVTKVDNAIAGIPSKTLIKDLDGVAKAVKLSIPEGIDDVLRTQIVNKTDALISLAKKTEKEIPIGSLEAYANSVRQARADIDVAIGNFKSKAALSESSAAELIKLQPKEAAQNTGRTLEQFAGLPKSEQVQLVREASVSNPDFKVVYNRSAIKNATQSGRELLNNPDVFAKTTSRLRLDELARLGVSAEEAYGTGVLGYAKRNRANIVAGADKIKEVLRSKGLAVRGNEFDYNMRLISQKAQLNQKFGKSFKELSDVLSTTAYKETASEALSDVLNLVKLDPRLEDFILDVAGADPLKAHTFIALLSGEPGVMSLLNSKYEDVYGALLKQFDMFEDVHALVEPIIGSFGQIENYHPLALKGVAGNPDAAFTLERITRIDKLLKGDEVEEVIDRLRNQFELDPLKAISQRFSDYAATMATRDVNDLVANSIMRGNLFQDIEKQFPVNVPNTSTPQKLQLLWDYAFNPADKASMLASVREVEEKLGKKIVEETADGVKFIDGDVTGEIIADFAKYNPDIINAELYNRVLFGEKAITPFTYAREIAQSFKINPIEHALQKATKKAVSRIVKVGEYAIDIPAVTDLESNVISVLGRAIEGARSPNNIEIINLLGIAPSNLSYIVKNVPEYLNDIRDVIGTRIKFLEDSVKKGEQVSLAELVSGIDEIVKEQTSKLIQFAVKSGTYKDAEILARIAPDELLNLQPKLAEVVQSVIDNNPSVADYGQAEIVARVLKEAKPYFTKLGEAKKLLPERAIDDIIRDGGAVIKKYSPADFENYKSFFGRVKGALSSQKIEGKNAGRIIGDLVNGVNVLYNSMLLATSSTRAASNILGNAGTTLITDGIEAFDPRLLRRNLELSSLLLTGRANEFLPIGSKIADTSATAGLPAGGRLVNKALDNLAKSVKNVSKEDVDIMRVMSQSNLGRATQGETFLRQLGLAGEGNVLLNMARKITEADITGSKRIAELADANLAVQQARSALKRSKGNIAEAVADINGIWKTYDDFSSIEKQIISKAYTFYGWQRTQAGALFKLAITDEVARRRMTQSLRAMFVNQDAEDAEKRYQARNYSPFWISWNDGVIDVEKANPIAEAINFVSPGQILDPDKLAAKLNFVYSTMYQYGIANRDRFGNTIDPLRSSELGKTPYGDGSYLRASGIFKRLLDASPLARQIFVTGNKNGAKDSATGETIYEVNPLVNYFVSRNPVATLGQIDRILIQQDNIASAKTPEERTIAEDRIRETLQSMLVLWSYSGANMLNKNAEYGIKRTEQEIYNRGKAILRNQGAIEEYTRVYMNPIQKREAGIKLSEKEQEQYNLWLITGQQAWNEVGKDIKLLTK